MSSLARLAAVGLGTIGLLAGVIGGMPTLTAAQPRPVKTEVIDALKFRFDWMTGGFGTVLLLNITITNPTPHAIKDVEIRCATYGASGTRLGELRQTVYELVKPKSTKKVKQVNMGFIHSQTDKVGCIISDLVLVAS